MVRQSVHTRSDSRPIPPDASHPSGSSTKPSTSRYTTRNVSWDPAVTVIAEPKANPTSRSPLHLPSSRTEFPRLTDVYPRSEERRRAGPALHPILVPETSAIFDARLAPSTVFPTKEIVEPATASGARHLRIISRDFPWTLEVSNRNQDVVSCADVFSAIYAGLSVALTPSEWTLADDVKKDSMMRANRNRRGGSVRRLRRIDWLGSRVYFKGLTKDDGLGRARLLPEDDLWPDTWVATFGSR